MIVAPDGTPVTSQPAEQSEATMADLDELLKRMEVFAARLGTMNPKSVQILNDAAWWMTMLATKVVELSAMGAALEAKLSPPPIDEEMAATRAALQRAVTSSVLVEELR